MDWSSLYAMQRELDNYIESNNDLHNKDVFEQKYLALLVELGELANETRCFKFWSAKPPSEKHTILEEYVDGIHFLLSLGNEIGHQYKGTPHPAGEISMTKQFNQVFERCTLFHQHPGETAYENMMENYLQLGELLGFSETDIKNAYYEKNEVNYDRQNQGY
ncbi:dUTP diphosphatase [Virgibacillus oceani]